MVFDVSRHNYSERKEKKFITIAIPCYCFKEEYIFKAINSVLNQSVNNWQLIIVDGSISGAPELKSFALSIANSRVTYVRNKSDISMAGNWNYCFKHATGELITLLHDDDELHIDYVKEMLAFANTFPESAAYYCMVNLIDGNSNATWTLADKVKDLIKPSGTENHIKGDSGLSSLLKGCFIFCPTVCYRTSKIQKKLFNAKWEMVTDFQSYYDLLEAGLTISGINKKLYNYRRHDHNQTAKLTRNFKRFEEEIEFYDFVRDSLPETWTKSINVARSKRIIKLHLLYLVVSNLVKGNFAQAKATIVFYQSRFFRH